MSKIILVFGAARAGSSLLTEVMSTFDGIKNLFEFFPHDQHDLKFGKTFDYLLGDLTQTELDAIFSPLGIDPTSGDAQSLKQRRNNIVELLTNIHITFPKNVCIKLQDYQVEDLDLEKIVRLPFVEVVVLERKHKLKTYVSALQAEKINNFKGVDTSNIKVVVDPRWFRIIKKTSNTFYSQLKSVLLKENKNYLYVTYEDDLENFSLPSIQKKINDWFQSVGVDVTPKNIPISYIKQNNNKLENVIENFDAIYQQIKDDL